MTQPKIRPGEPIKPVTMSDGPVRYKAVVDVAPKGAPRKQVKKTFDSLAAARAWVAEIRLKKASGQPITAPSRVTVGVLAGEWVASRTDLREKSRRGYEAALRHALDGSKAGKVAGLRNRPVQGIEHDEIQRLITALGELGGKSGQGLSRRSVEYVLTSLQQVFTYAEHRKLRPAGSNPCRSIRLPRVSKVAARSHKVEPWTPDELRQFRDHVDLTEVDATMRAVWRLVLCGLRRSEVCGLTWSHVDFETGVVHVEQGRVVLGAGEEAVDDAKSEASDRYLPVDVLCAGTLDTLRAAYAQQTETLGREPDLDDFISTVRGLRQGAGAEIRPLGPDALSKRFGRMCERAGVRRIKLHGVRHRLATALANLGVNPADGAALLGHTTEVYLAVYNVSTASGRLDAAARAAGALYGAPVAA